MFDTSFRWTILKIGIITLVFLLITNFLLVKVLELFLSPDLAALLTRMLIGLFLVLYLVIYPKYTSLRNNKIIDDLTDSENESFLKFIGGSLVSFGLLGFVTPDRFGIWIYFELVIGICLYTIGSARLQIREKGIFTQFGLYSWENIASYESNVLGIVLRQKGWRRFFPTLHKVVPWQRTKLEKYLAELQPYLNNEGSQSS